MGREQVTNQTRMGEPVASADGMTGAVQRAAHLIGSVLPLMSDSLVRRTTEEVGLDAAGKEPRSWGAVAGDVPVEIMGASTWDMPLQDFLMKQAEDLLGEKLETWIELEPVRRDAILMHPSTRPVYRRKANTNQRERMEIRWAAYDQQVIEDNYLLNGLRPQGDGYTPFDERDWINAYMGRKKDTYARLDSLSETIDLDNYVATTEEQELMQNYYALFDDPELMTGGIFNSEAFHTKKRIFLDGLEFASENGLQDRMYVERNSVRYATPVVKRYLRDRKLIDRYYDIGTDPELHASGYGPEVKDAWSMMMEGISKSTILRQITDSDRREGLNGILITLLNDQKELRKRLRVNNPDIDRAMVKWQNITPATNEGKAALDVKDKKLKWIDPLLKFNRPPVLEE